LERTDGNVLFLKELVLGALEARVLSDEGGVWRLQGHLPPSARLVELVEGRLAGLAEAERETLEVLALGEPLGVELLQGLKRDASLPGLERQGLARVDEDGRRLGVRLAHPLYGEVVRSRLSPLRVRTLSRMLAQATTTAGGRRRDDVLRIAAWQLQGGGSLDLDIMLAGARQAHARHDLDLAERLARAAREEGGGFEAGLLLGVVVSQAGRFKEADADLGTLAPEAATDDQRVALALTRIQYLIASGAGSGEAIRVAAEAEATILDPGARAQVAASRTYLLSMGGRQPEARELAESVLSWATGRGLVIASMVACPLFGRAGRLADALAANDRGLATHLALADRSFWYCPQLHVLTRSMALTLAGCSVAAEAAAHGEYLKAVADGSVDGQAYSSWALSLALLAQGRVESAARWGRLAVELTRRTGQTRTVANTLLSLAMALALAGRAEEASNVVAEREALPKSGEEYPVQALLTRAWIFVARGDRLMATEVLTEASLVARNEGSFAEESAALHDLARLGHAAGVAPRLAELAEIVEGPLTPARAAHAAALVEKDPAALDAASVVFEEMNALLLAAEAAADAAVAWRKAGDPRRAAAAERRAHALAGKCEGARTPALTAVGARAALTARELEIARLAAAGVANKEIAARLYLSLHTVQNKLHAAYEKLGVEGRAELAQALEDY
jgi:DNA-binding CsgD family transcriptional regulator